MGTWNTHGMDEDENEIEEAILRLGFIPEELDALCEYARREAYVLEKFAERSSGQEKRKANMMAKHWVRRGRKWKELSAKLESELDEEARGNSVESRS